jgi:iron complex outermembrane receptor protein
LPPRTYISLGARRLYYRRDSEFLLYQTIGGVRNTPAPLISQSSSRPFNKWVYDAKLVQHLDDSKIVYFSYGHGFRGPGANRGVPLPAIPSIQTLPAESSNSYEVGFKGQFFDRRVTLNIDVYQQNYSGFNSVAGDIPYCPNYAPNCQLVIFPGFSIPLASSGQVVFAGDARVRGVEADLSARITDRWSLQGTLAYADGKFKNAQVPYRPDLNGDGVPDTDTVFATLATQPLYFRPSSAAISDVPKWNFTLQSEYSFPLAQAQVYVRGLFVYNGSRTDVSGANTYPAEGMLNLYLGARDIVPGLDISIFAKNVTDIRKLEYASVPMSFGSFSTGYRQVLYTPERQVGITARFSFGGG